MKTKDMKAYRREYMRRWRDENREAVREAGIRSNRKNAAKRAEWRARPENRKRAIERSTAYRERLGFDGRKDQRLRQMYGIGLSEWKQRVSDQYGRCPICLVLLEGNRPHLDHDHTTGANRDILCSRCNQAIGLLKESPASAERLAAYLKKHGRE